MCFMVIGNAMVGSMPGPLLLLMEEASLACGRDCSIQQGRQGYWIMDESSPFPHCDCMEMRDFAVVEAGLDEVGYATGPCGCNSFPCTHSQTAILPPLWPEAGRHL